MLTTAGKLSASVHREWDDTARLQTHWHHGRYQTVSARLILTVPTLQMFHQFQHSVVIQSFRNNTHTHNGNHFDDHFKVYLNQLGVP